MSFRGQKHSLEHSQHSYRLRKRRPQCGYFELYSSDCDDNDSSEDSSTQSDRAATDLVDLPDLGVSRSVLQTDGARDEEHGRQQEEGNPNFGILDALEDDGIETEDDKSETEAEGEHTVTTSLNIQEIEDLCEAARRRRFASKTHLAQMKGIFSADSIKKEEEGRLILKLEHQIESIFKLRDIVWARIQDSKSRLSRRGTDSTTIHERFKCALEALGNLPAVGEVNGPLPSTLKTCRRDANVLIDREEGSRSIRMAEKKCRDDEASVRKWQQELEAARAQVTTWNEELEQS